MKHRKREVGMVVLPAEETGKCSTCLRASEYLVIYASGATQEVCLQCARDLTRGKMEDLK